MTDLDISGTLNINDLPFTEDRTRAWRELRGAGEAVSSGEEVVLTSAEAVEFAAKRPEIFSSAKAFDRLGSPVPLVPIAIDPPDHTRFRRMLDPFFSPKKMAEREPELRRQAGELIDAIVARGECDVVTDLATPFPSQVFLTLFGLPMADRDRLVQWKDAILQFTDPSSTEATPAPITMPHSRSRGGNSRQASAIGPSGSSCRTWSTACWTSCSRTWARRAASVR